MQSCPPGNRIGVVMAGGAGERFWPLSRTHRPKQLLKLSGSGMTLLEEAVERLVPLIPRERIYVATGIHLHKAITETQLVPPGNVLAEPCKRNTAGCLIYVAAHCLARYGHQAQGLTLAVTTADHRVGDPDRFLQTIGEALRTVETDPVLATIGITPTRPDTGFGYIEVQRDARTAGSGGRTPVVWPVKRFCEKPDESTARIFLQSGRFLWNSGMFFWKLSTFMQELEQARPQMAAITHELARLMAAGETTGVQRSFARLEDLSIDYALMEQARRVVVVHGDFAWDDVGSWDALTRFYPTDARGNVVVGDAVTLDTRDCVVYNEPGAEHMAVGVLGVEGLVVVVSSDGVLVLPRERSQDVRQIVGLLKDRGASQI